MQMIETRGLEPAAEPEVPAAESPTPVLRMGVEPPAADRPRRGRRPNTGAGADAPAHTKVTGATTSAVPDAALLGMLLIDADARGLTVDAYCEQVLGPQLDAWRRWRGRHDTQQQP
jgi:hypothetical protein